VSRSVTNETDNRAEEYRKSWKALMAMAEGGSSFSGYERHCCFLNTGDGRFANASSTTGWDFLDDGRAVALVDWDSDGDLDVWTANRTAPRLRFLRNNAGTQNGFLAIRLVGKTCNRDAIGSRLELHLKGEHGKKLIRTLKAGEGFIAQSSKWVHFGLGSAAEIDKLVVRWPGGISEEFKNLRPNHRYRLVQGSETPEPFQDSPRHYQLRPSETKIAPETDAGRVPFAMRAPLPTLNFRGFDSKAYQWKSSGPFLLNLWASWCTPCVAELHEFAEQHDRLKNAGLSIIALSVESLPGAQRDGVDAAAALAQRSNFAFQSGLVNPEFYDQLSLVYGSLFQDQRPFPVPMSFLVDGDGWMTVAYRGVVKVDRLLEDVKLLKMPPREYLDAVLPYTGKWYRPPLFPNTINGNLGWLATALEVGGHIDESLRYWRGYFDYNKKAPRPIDQNDARLWNEELTRIQTEEAGKIFVQAGRLDDAIRACEEALKIRPDFVRAAINRADLLEKTNRQMEAVSAYRALLPNIEVGAIAAVQLVLLLATHPNAKIRNGVEALQIARKLCESRQYQDPYYLDLLAAAFAETGQFEQATRTMQRAIELAHSAGNPTLVGQFEARQKQYARGEPLRSR